MKAVLLIFIIIAIFEKTIVAEDRDHDHKGITCNDIKNVTVIGQAFIWFASNEKDQIQVVFHLSTNKHPEPINISPSDWSGLQTSGFNPSEKTILIIHGFKSGGTKKWVIGLKDKLLQARQANIILVDWSQASNDKNYVNAARNTELATNRIFNFLQQMRVQIDQLFNNQIKKNYNNLYFIGHSLGAQVSGQTAHLLKEDSFWKVERITALDPAKPCFTNVDQSLRVGKEDANFVDVIHTQTGKGGSTDALGLRDSIGHVDFYVNTGIVQPGCLGSFTTPRWQTMICSHRLAYTYYTESVENSITGDCKFVSYPWNGTYLEAQNYFTNLKNGQVCNNCPEMGINAINTNKMGNFLVITSPKEPHCVKPSHFNEDDSADVIKVIRKLKKGVSAFDETQDRDIMDLNNPIIHIKDTPGKVDASLYTNSSTTQYPEYLLHFMLCFLLLVCSKVNNIIQK